MFGLENISSQVKGLVDTSIKGVGVEFLKSIPGYGVWSQFAQKYVARRQGEALGKREDTTVVDQGEINTSFKRISKELGGTYNPFSLALNFVKRFFGSSSIERAGAELSTLQSYSNLYDSQMFANDTMKYLLSRLKSRISNKEGLLSKLGLRTNSKVNDDNAVQQLKATMKAWLTPYRNILHGGVPGVGFSKSDWDFITYMRDQIRSGYGAKYLKDLLPDFQNLVQEAHQMYLERYNKEMRAKRLAEEQKSLNPNQRLAQPIAA